MRHSLLAALLTAAACTTIQRSPSASVAAPVAPPVHQLADGDSVLIRGPFEEAFYGHASEKDGTTIFGEAHIDAAVATLADGTPLDGDIELASTSSYELIAPAQGDCPEKPLVQIHKGELLVLVNELKEHAGVSKGCAAMAAQAMDGTFHAKLAVVTAAGMHLDVELEFK